MLLRVVGILVALWSGLSLADELMLPHPRSVVSIPTPAFFQQPNTAKYRDSVEIKPIDLSAVCRDRRIDPKVLDIIVRTTRSGEATKEDANAREFFWGKFREGHAAVGIGLTKDREGFTFFDQSVSIEFTRKDGKLTAEDQAALFRDYLTQGKRILEFRSFFNFNQYLGEDLFYGFVLNNLPLPQDFKESESLHLAFANFLTGVTPPQPGPIAGDATGILSEDSEGFFKWGSLRLKVLFYKKSPTGAGPMIQLSRNAQWELWSRLRWQANAMRSGSDAPLDANAVEGPRFVPDAAFLKSPRFGKPERKSFADWRRGLLNYEQILQGLEKVDKNFADAFRSASDSAAAVIWPRDSFGTGVNSVDDFLTFSKDELWVAKFSFERFDLNRAGQVEPPMHGRSKFALYAAAELFLEKSKRGNRAAAGQFRNNLALLEQSPAYRKQNWTLLEIADEEEGRKRIAGIIADFVVSEETKANRMALVDYLRMRKDWLSFHEKIGREIDTELEAPAEGLRRRADDKFKRDYEQLVGKPFNGELPTNWIPEKY